MAKEIAEELLDEQRITGINSYVYALEKLANGTQQIGRASCRERVLLIV